MFIRQYSAGISCGAICGLVVAVVSGFVPSAHATSFSCEDAWDDICASSTCTLSSIEEKTYRLGSSEGISCHFNGVTCNKNNGQTQTTTSVETFDFLVQGLVNCNGELKDQNYCSDPVPPC